jgi:hypothetical protein
MRPSLREEMLGAVRGLRGPCAQDAPLWPYHPAAVLRTARQVPVRPALHQGPAVRAQGLGCLLEIVLFPFFRECLRFHQFIF